MNLTKSQVLDIYEQALSENADELYLNQSEEYRNGFLDGAYVLYLALTEEDS